VENYAEDVQERFIPNPVITFEEAFRDYRKCYHFAIIFVEMQPPYPCVGTVILVDINQKTQARNIEADHSKFRAQNNG